MTDHSLTDYLRRSSDEALQQMLQGDICTQARQEVLEEIEQRRGQREPDNAF